MARRRGRVYRRFLAAAAGASIATIVLLVIHPTPPPYYASVVSVLDDDGQRQQMQSALTLGMQARSPLRNPSRRPARDPVQEVKNPTPPRYYTSIISFSGVGGDHQRQRMQVALTLGLEARLVGDDKPDACDMHYSQ
jgi:hypothetical protein